jgi:hypothetical protein
MVPLTLPSMAPNASHREQHDRDRATRKEQRGGNVQHINPAGPNHGRKRRLGPGWRIDLCQRKEAAGLTRDEETNRQTERLVRRRKAAIGKVGPRRNEYSRNHSGSWPTCRFCQDDGPRDEANTSEESKEAVRLGRPLQEVST